MVVLKSLFDASPLIPLFLCLAVGYGIGQVRIGGFQLGGIVGTLFAAIVIGQVRVETNPVVKTLAFALFIYSLGLTWSVPVRRLSSQYGRAVIIQ